jgi:hypothetical protein
LAVTNQTVPARRVDEFHVGEDGIIEALQRTWDLARLCSRFSNAAA